MSPFGDFDVFVQHDTDASNDDYKKDARNAFIKDSGAGVGFASVSQIKAIDIVNPSCYAPKFSVPVKNADWAHVVRVVK